MGTGEGEMNDEDGQFQTWWQEKVGISETEPQDKHC